MHRDGYRHTPGTVKLTLHNDASCSASPCGDSDCIHSYNSIQLTHDNSFQLTHICDVTYVLLATVEASNGGHREGKNVHNSSTKTIDQASIESVSG